MYSSRIVAYWRMVFLSRKLKRRPQGLQEFRRPSWSVGIEAKTPPPGNPRTLNAWGINENGVHGFPARLDGRGHFQRNCRKQSELTAVILGMTNTRGLRRDG